MIIKIRVVTGAKKERILRAGDKYKVYVSAPPEKGKANQKVIELIADFFKIKKNQVKIVKGLKSKDKTVIVEI